MTTKAQEKKALEQIRKIVEGLGEQSYIGTALTGCLEDADENIDFDAAFSMQGRWLAAKDEIAELKEKLANATDQAKNMTEQMNSLEAMSIKPELASTISNDYRKQLIALNDELRMAAQALVEMIGAVSTGSLDFTAMVERVATLKRQIAHLESVKTQIDQYNE